MRKFAKFAVVVVAFTFIPMLAVAQQITLVHTITGMPLDLNLSPKEGRDTPAVKEFLKTGHDPYVGVESCLHEAEELYLTACSGCHGHVGEGKLGPGLNDNYWTYPKNMTDKGLFRDNLWRRQKHDGTASVCPDNGRDPADHRMGPSSL